MLRSWRDAVSISNQKKATKSARRIKTHFSEWHCWCQKCVTKLVVQVIIHQVRPRQRNIFTSEEKSSFSLAHDDSIPIQIGRHPLWSCTHRSFGLRRIIGHFDRKKKWGEKCARQTFTDTLLWFLQVSEVKEEKELMTSSTGRWVRTNTRNATAGENQKATVVFFFEPECFESTDYYSSISGM